MPAAEIPFVKMEGCGNDYVYVEMAALPGDVAARLEADPGSFARAISDRHFGVGGDGLVLIGAAEAADAAMHMFNADGSRGAMCGNALRCIAKLLGDREPSCDTLRIATDGGLREARLERAGQLVERVEIDMGRPVFAADRIPFDVAQVASAAGGTAEPWCIDIEIGSERVRGHVLSLGNPHFVIRADEQLDGLPLEAVGPALETAACFPDRANIEFVAVAGPNRLRQRTWERGSGETLACGSGACAAGVVAVYAGWAEPDKPIRVGLRGGGLDITVEASGAVRMCGPARVAFRGSYILES